jgi:hypothetical protein
MSSPLLLSLAALNLATRLPVSEALAIEWYRSYAVEEECSRKMVCMAGGLKKNHKLRVTNAEGE